MSLSVKVLLEDFSRNISVKFYKRTSQGTFLLSFIRGLL